MNDAARPRRLRGRAQLRVVQRGPDPPGVIGRCNGPMDCTESKTCAEPTERTFFFFI